MLYFIIIIIISIGQFNEFKKCQNNSIRKQPNHKTEMGVKNKFRRIMEHDSLIILSCCLYGIT